MDDSMAGGDPARADLLAALDGGTFDLLVVGGGISGASIAWHAARAGLRTALVERDDFGAGATANCLKIVHGGLRYLQHLDLARMRQSIGERSAWLRAAPHLVEPLPVVMPTFQGVFPPRWLLAGALAVNDVVAADRNRHLTQDRRLPRGRLLSRRECIRRVPELDVPGLTGGIAFHDAIMYSAERLALEVVLAARAAGANLLNHAEFTGAVTRAGRVVGARVRDTLTGRAMEVGARWVVNATGSAAAVLSASVTGQPWRSPPRYSVALNLVTRRPAPRVAYTVAGGQADPDRVGRGGRRQLFVVPWRGQTLIGTAHLPYHGDPSTFALRDEHVAAFLAEIAAGSPALNVTPDDIVGVHSGLLPVADGPAGAAIRLLKRHRIVDHAADGLSNVLSVVSVKYTTAQVIAREVVARIRGRAADPAARPAAGTSPGPADAGAGSADGEVGPGLPRTGSARTQVLPGGAFESLDRLRIEAAARAGGRVPEDVVEHLVRSYGARYGEVLGVAEKVDGGMERVVPGAPVIRAQLVHGALRELACTPEDLVWRRTEIGPRGLATAEALGQAAEALAAAARLQARRGAV